jgi:hypothetical protein
MDLSRNRYKSRRKVAKFNEHAIYANARLEEDYLPTYRITHLCESSENTSQAGSRISERPRVGEI